MEMDPTNYSRDVQFYEFTGRSFVYPITCKIHGFQKDIIKATIRHNVLISLPPGLGKSLLAAVITFNFHRWFNRGKIVVLSQTRSYLTDQISAYNSYTTLSDDLFVEIPGNASDEDCKTACKQSIILATPQKFLSCLVKDLCEIQNIILLVVIETSKISKCQEYQEIVNRIHFGEYRILTFIDPVGINLKIIKQIVEMFKISKLKIKNLNSPEIKNCTFTAAIESIVVDVSPHIRSIKDNFLMVFEKYGKKLKDSKVINGNVGGLTRAQVLKSKEKFLKNPPQNLSKVERDNFLNCLTMCAFLSHGIELLHNWGVRAFYQYLFDPSKDDDLKMLMKSDENLTKQMTFLDEYLKPNGKNIDATLSRIVHPKLLSLKSTVNQYFSGIEPTLDQLRIIVLCSMESVIDDMERIFSTLREEVRCQFVKTKAKSLSNEAIYKETIENFRNGVINVLVITNLVDEIMEIKSSIIISLEPIKALFKLSDPSFNETTKTCLFIVTKGSEENKFEALLHEKHHEHKPLDVIGVQELQTESSKLFPENFNPEFEDTIVRDPRKTFRNSPGQKSILQFFDSKLAASSPAVCELGTRNKKSKNSLRKSIFCNESKSIFADDSSLSSQSTNIIDESQPAADSYLEDPLPFLPDPFVKPTSVVKETTNDSFDDLVLDFSNDLRDSKLQNPLPSKKVSSSPSLITSCTSPIIATRPKFSWAKRNDQKSRSSASGTESECSRSDDSSSKVKKVSQFKKSRSCDIGLEDLPNVSFVDDLFSDSGSNSEVDDNEKRETDVLKNDASSRVAFPDDESFGDYVFSEIPPKSRPKNAVVSNQQPTTANIGKNSDPFRRSLFSSTSPLNNNDPKTVCAQNESRCQANKYPLLNDAEDDLFVDVSWINTSATARKIDTYAKSSAIIHRSVSSATAITHPPKSMSPTFDSTSDFSRALKTVNESSQSSRIPDFSATEIPSEIFDDFVPASPPFKSWSHPVQETCKKSTPNTSPVLFSLKKSNRKRVSSTYNDQRNRSINFESLFDVSEENLRQLERRTSAASLKDKEADSEQMEMVPSTPPASDERFDSIFFDKDDVDDELLFVDVTTRGLVAGADDNVATKNVVSGDVVDKVDQLEVSSTSPSLFDLHNNEVSNNKSDYIDATVTVAGGIPPMLRPALSAPFGVAHGNDKTRSSFGETPKNKSFNVRKRSTPLFDESDNNFGSPPCPGSRSLRPTLQSKIHDPTSSSDDAAAEKKKRLFWNFAATVKQKLSVSDGGPSTDEMVSRVEETKHPAGTASASMFDESDDDFPWLKRTSPPDRLPRTSCFKKPEHPPAKSRCFSRTSTPGNWSDGSELAGTPTPPAKKRPLKKRWKSKRNLAEQFIDAEAEVTDDDDDDGNENSYLADECNHLLEDSFIDDDSSTRLDNMSHYLKSIKSPNAPIGKFRIPVLSEKQLNVNVYSQVAENDQTYENDSFCVEEDELDIEDSYVPSVLTQMEERLVRRRKEQNLPAKGKQFKRIRIIDDSSPESPVVQQNHRKRVRRRVSSDNEN